MFISHLTACLPVCLFIGGRKKKNRSLFNVHNLSLVLFTVHYSWPKGFSQWFFNVFCYTAPPGDIRTWAISQDTVFLFFLVWVVLHEMFILPLFVRSLHVFSYRAEIIFGRYLIVKNVPLTWLCYFCQCSALYCFLRAHPLQDWVSVCRTVSLCFACIVFRMHSYFQTSQDEYKIQL